MSFSGMLDSDQIASVREVYKWFDPDESTITVEKLQKAIGYSTPLVCFGRFFVLFRPMDVKYTDVECLDMLRELKCEISNIRFPA